MIPKKWKEEWLLKQEEKLAKEFGIDLEHLKNSFDEILTEWNKKKIDLETSITFQEKECEELTKRLNQRKQELIGLNEDLKRQIRIIEENTSPSHVWEAAFTAGFNKAWEMMVPIMMDGVNKTKKLIEDNAIQETIRRNGNYKKNN